jgi:hypothetical protein
MPPGRGISTVDDDRWVRALEKLSALEAGQRAQHEDMVEVKAEMKDLRRSVTTAHSGLSRSERIALAGVLVTIALAVIATLALVLGAPGR